MTTHEPDGRTPKTVRLTQAGIDMVQEIADAYGCQWTEAARRLLQLGAHHAPATWPPKRWPRRHFGNKTFEAKAD